jgi:hypothetical protein
VNGPAVANAAGDVVRRRCAVLRAEDNEILTRVGPGTLMGRLLRRYWTVGLPGRGDPRAVVD